MLDFADFTLQERPRKTAMAAIQSHTWYNGSHSQLSEGLGKHPKHTGEGPWCGRTFRMKADRMAGYKYFVYFTFSPPWLMVFVVTVNMKTHIFELRK